MSTLGELAELLETQGIGGRSVLFVPSALGSEPAKARAITPVSLEIDSRQVAPGQIFACVRGAHSDGHDFAASALSQGASALIVDHQLDLVVPQLVVSDVRRALGPVAAMLAGDPSLRIPVMGVTGTNGKTTVATLLRAIYEAGGLRLQVVGTLTGERTTPEAHQLQPLIARAHADGAAALAMEVSSHALVQHRVDGTRFAVAAFTNLTQDHLDFHLTMEAYFEAKALLFDPEWVGAAVINADDPAGQELIRRWNERAEVPAVTYSLTATSVKRVDGAGVEFLWRGHLVRSPLLGRHNIANALLAAESALALGVDEATIVGGLGVAMGAAGRLESIDEGQPFRVLVDYAHTPDALRSVLAAARELAQGGRVIAVFGCGGDRDAAKRAPMGAAASELADVAVLTDDNPRSEAPAEIRAAVRRGMTGRAALVEEPDRRAAIGLALQAARAGDVVVIAGKGHETGQTVGDITLPFDDRVVVREELAASWLSSRGDGH